VTEDLRALLRADLIAERPPPLGDLVGAALRDGRRRRRNRRLGTLGAGTVLAVLVAGMLLPGTGAGARETPPLAPAGRPAQAAPAAAAIPPVPPGTASPQTVPIAPTAPIVLSAARTLTIHSGTERAGGMQKKATSAAMLHLLTQLLPPGRASHFGVASDNDLHVQLYLDGGAGPGMVRVAVGKVTGPGGEAPRGDTATVTIEHLADDCVQDTAVVAQWPDGTMVELDVASCLASDGRGNPPARPALTAEQAVRIVSDPRWGVRMDAALVAAGAARFPKLPVFG
jgi:hypothetical protein